MMKKLSVFSAVFLFSIALFAGEDSFSSEFIRRVEEGSVRIGFSLKMLVEDRNYSSSGTVVFQKGMYRLQSDYFDVYDDGTSMWTVNKSSREVVGESSSGADIIADPSSVLALFGFEPRGSKICVRNTEDGMPSAIDVILKDGSTVTIGIIAISFDRNEPEAFFSFDSESLDSSYFVTDLR